MALRLSSRQIDQVREAIRLLSSPMDHASVDAWRSAVNRHMKAMLAADSAGFVLPVPNGPLLYSEEHDPAATVKFGELLPPDRPDGKPIWLRGIELGVCTMDTVYDGDPSPYYRSAYYHEYAKPNDAAQTLGALMSLGASVPNGAAALQLWRGQRNPKRFGEDDIALMRLLFPALQVGVENYIRFGSDTAEFLRVCDSLGSALLVCDSSGRIVHQTPAMTRLLDMDPQSTELRAQLQQMATQAAPAAGATAPSGVSNTRIETRTASARYVMRVSSMRAMWTTGPWLVASLERLTPSPQCPADLQAKFGLTRAESRVAVCLLAGRRPKEIAVELGISWSTVRRHTERIYVKAGVRSRVELMAKV